VGPEKGHEDDQGDDPLLEVFRDRLDGALSKLI